jgi:hypothetical protein
MLSVGQLLRSRRAGETHLAWNAPNLSGLDTLTLSSPDFRDGETMPLETTDKRVGGQGRSPRLAWTEPPAGTAELLLVIEDVDVPMGKPFVHGLFRLDPARIDPGGQLPAGALTAGAKAAKGSPSAAPPGVRLLRSSMGTGYQGPAPIKGHGPHQYVFQLFALGAPLDDSADGARPRDFLARITAPVLVRGRLTGVYER